MTTITAELGPNYQVSISNGVHAWGADEPTDVGGDDTGPNPYDLLLGALAACTVITLAAYARRKGIELRSVSAEFSHDRIHAEDCLQCDERHVGLVDRVTSRVFIDGDFDDATPPPAGGRGRPLPRSPHPGSRCGVRRDRVRRLTSSAEKPGRAETGGADRWTDCDAQMMVVHTCG